METYVLLPESQYKKCFPLHEEDPDLKDNSEEEHTTNTSREVIEKTEISNDPQKVEEYFQPHINPYNFTTPSTTKKRQRSPSTEISSTKKIKPTQGEKRLADDDRALNNVKKFKTNGAISDTDQGNLLPYKIF